MVFHQISIRNDVYEKLIQLKKENESFSDLLDRLSQKAKESWQTLEQLNGIGGSDTLKLETVLQGNRTDLEGYFKKRLGINEL